MYFRFPILALVLLALSGCSMLDKKESEPPKPVATVEKPAPQPPAPAIPRKPPPPPEVAIILSSDIPAYRGVADELVKRLDGRAEVYSLKGRSDMAGKVIDMVKNSGREQVVAVGLGAALAAKELADRQVVFCQVFNYADHQLLGPNSKGVSLLPGLDKTFATWRGISPNLVDVGVISGGGFDDMLDLASAAAAQQGIRLHHVAVESDKEYQYAYKQMADEVQGYWLLPDNRVLSRGILRDVMTFSVKSGKQVLVFSDELLKLGGVLSAASIETDVADKVLARLAQAAHKGEIPGADITPLDDAVLRINAVMAQRLNLIIPGQYSEYSGVSIKQ